VVAAFGVAGHDALELEYERPTRSAVWSGACLSRYLTSALGLRSRFLRELSSSRQGPRPADRETHTGVAIEDGLRLSAIAGRTHPHLPRRRSSRQSRSTGGRGAKALVALATQNWPTAGPRRKPHGRSFVCEPPQKMRSGHLAPVWTRRISAPSAVVGSKPPSAGPARTGKTFSSALVWSVAAMKAGSASPVRAFSHASKLRTSQHDRRARQTDIGFALRVARYKKGPW